MSDLTVSGEILAEWSRRYTRRVSNESGTWPVAAIVVDYAGVLTDVESDRLYELLDRARDRGLRTALLSNAAGGGSVRRRLSGWFDVLVFSGEVGVVKPQREIFLLTAERLGVPPEACVFVDDAPGNVTGAVAAGMVGVRHTSVRDTVDELTALLPGL